MGALSWIRLCKCKPHNCWRWRRGWKWLAFWALSIWKCKFGSKKDSEATESLYVCVIYRYVCLWGPRYFTSPWWALARKKDGVDLIFTFVMNRQMKSLERNQKKLSISISRKFYIVVISYCHPFPYQESINKVFDSIKHCYSYQVLVWYFMGIVEMADRLLP